VKVDRSISVLPMWLDGMTMGFDRCPGGEVR
jgi:hypothetical protein